MRWFARFALLAGLPAALSAQTIRGTVVDATARGVSGVVVLMVDSASNVVARGLSNTRGDFSVAAARAGNYTLRTMRIGFRPTTTDAIKLLSGGESTQRIVLNGLQIQLDTMRVVDKSSCRIDSDASAAATFAAFDQARTALSAAQLTLAGRTINATTLAYDRTLEADGRRVLKQTSQVTNAYVAQPWRAISPDAVHRAGFVVVGNDNSVTYHAPSMDVLLSPTFLADHCFHLVNDRKRPTELGIAFEPASERRQVPEIKGTIWLDRKSAELKVLQYRYTNISDEQENAGAGGDVEFARLANGGWAISRWDIRMPVLEQYEGVHAGARNGVRVAGIQVTGGALFLAKAGRDTLWSRSALALNGELVDSVSGKAIADGRVSLAGTGLSAAADARGRFTIPGVLPGTYTLESHTPELDKIGGTGQTSLTFDDSTKTYTIRVPNAAQLVASVCPSGSIGASNGAIMGRVFERGDTVPSRGAKVVAEWSVLTTQPGQGNSLARDARRVEGRTADDGSYRLCGVPLNTAVNVSASNPKAASPDHGTTLSGAFTRIDLMMDQVAEGTASFSGMVLVDSLKTPIVLAEVSIVDLGKTTISDTKGAFAIHGIPAGEHHVVVRRVGYGPFDTKITFADHATLTRDVLLPRAVRLDSVVVKSTSLARELEDFEHNRKLGFGHFWTREDLEKLRDRSLASIFSETPGLAVIKGVGSAAWIAARRGNKSLGSAFSKTGAYPVDSVEKRLGALEGTCYSSVYLDGHRVFRPTPGRLQMGMFNLALISPDQIEAIEYYAGPAETPQQYNDSDSDCGVLVIHTRRSR